MSNLKKIHRALGDRLPLEVVTHFCVYAGGKFLISGFSLLSAPIMMILLQPADYGLLSLIHSFNNIAIAVVSLGLPQIFMVEYFKCNELESEQAFNDILLIYCCCTVPIMLIALLFPQLIQHYLFIPTNLSYVVYGIIGICFFSFFNDIFYNILQYQRRAKTVTITQVLVSALTVSFNIVLLSFFHVTVACCVWVQFALVMGVFFVGGYCYIHNQYYHSFDSYRSLSRTSGYLKQSLPLLPGTLVAWIFALINRWMMARLGGLELAGIFSLADAGGLLLYRLILHPLQGAYGPALMRSYQQECHQNHKIERSNHQVMFVILVFLIICLVTGYFLIKKLLYSLIPVAYGKAVDCVLGIAIGYVWLIGAYFVSNYIQFQKKQLIFVVALVFSIMLNCALNFYLIPVYGLHGCVVSIMISYGLYFMILFCYNRYLLVTL